MSFATMRWACLMPVLLLAGITASARPAGASELTTVFANELPNVAGKKLTAITVTFLPGEKSPKHHHAGSVFVYVLSGAVRSENSATGPARIYKAGETFFEPPGSTHLISENASQTEPATILTVFFADDGAQLTTMDK
jgi:quercetin dioxygenase-like cupin family protein